MLTHFLPSWDYFLLVDATATLLLATSSAIHATQDRTRRPWTWVVLACLLHLAGLGVLLLETVWPEGDRLHIWTMCLAAALSLALCEALRRQLPKSAHPRGALRLLALLVLPGAALIGGALHPASTFAAPAIAGIGVTAGLSLAVVSWFGSRRRAGAAPGPIGLATGGSHREGAWFGAWGAAAALSAGMLVPRGLDLPHGIGAAGLVALAAAALAARLSLALLRADAARHHPDGVAGSARGSMLLGERLLLAGIGVAVVLGWGSASFLAHLQDQAMRVRLRSRAEGVAAGLPADQLAGFTRSPADMADSAHVRLRAGLESFVRAASDVRYIYCMAMDGDSLRFTLDSTPASSPDYTPPGDVYFDAPPEVDPVFRSAEARVAGPYTDRWGTFVSAFVPVVDPSTGQLVEVLGMDIQADRWDLTVRRQRLPALVVAFLLSSLLCAGLLAARLRSRHTTTPPWPLRFAEALVAGLAVLLLTWGSLWAFHRQAVSVKEAEYLRRVAASDYSALQRGIHEAKDHLGAIAELISTMAAASPEELRRIVEASQAGHSRWLALGVATASRGSGGEASWRLLAGTEHLSRLLAGPDEGASVRLVQEACSRAARSGLPTAVGPLAVAGGSHARHLIAQPIWSGAPRAGRPGASPPGTAVLAVLDWTGLKQEFRPPLRQVSSGAKTVVCELSRDGAALPLSWTDAPDGPAAGYTLEDPRDGSAVWSPVFEFGRSWVLESTPTAAAIRSAVASWTGWVLLAAGILVAAAVTGVLALVQEGRLRAEALAAARTRELAESTQTFRSISEAAFDAILMIDSAGRITYWNQAATRIFGYGPEEALGRALHPLLAPEEAVAGWEKARPRFAADGTGAAIGQTLALTAVHRDGRPIPVELSLASVELHGEWHAVGIVRDISERRQAEREQESLRQALLQAQKLESVGQLAAGVAHEINTPVQFVSDNLRFVQTSWQETLTVLQALGQLKEAARAIPALAEPVAQADRAAESADVEWLRDEVSASIQQSLDGMERVATIVRALKGFAHPGPRQKGPADLNEAIRNTVTISRNEWKYVAECVLDLQSDLPPVTCICGEITQVVLNLIVNAAHAIAARKDRRENELGRITVSTRLAGDWVELAVSDTGSGIPEEIRQRIFDPFFTTKEVGKGTGQGLSIARRIVVGEHGGEISFESEVGKGTTFRVRLPLDGETGGEEDLLEAAA